MNTYRKTKKRTETSSRFNLSPSVVLLLLSIFTFAVTQLVYLSLFGVRGEDLSEIQREKLNLAGEINDLDNTINDLKSISRIHDQAKGDLGLETNSDVRIVENNNRYSSNVTSND